MFDEVAGVETLAAPACPEDLGVSGLADAVVAVRRSQAELEARRWALVAAWAAAHRRAGAGSPARREGGEREVPCGGPGTPVVAEFAAVADRIAQILAVQGDDLSQLPAAPGSPVARVEGLGPRRGSGSATGRTRETVRLRHPVEVFPHGTLSPRAADLDHVVPYQVNGPPGQTSADNPTRECCRTRPEPDLTAEQLRLTDRRRRAEGSPAVQVSATNGRPSGQGASPRSAGCTIG